MTAVYEHARLVHYFNLCLSSFPVAKTNLAVHEDQKRVPYVKVSIVFVH